MIKHWYFIAVLWCCLLRSAIGQEASFPKGFYARLGVAYCPVLNAPQISPLIDPLVSLPRHNVSVPYEVQWQINQRIGLVFQFRHVNISSNIRADFTEQVSRQFPDDYATVQLPDVYSEFSHGEDAAQTFVAVSYAMGAGKWSLQPRFMLGGTTYYPQAAHVALKRRDSNQLNLITLQPEDVDADNGAAFGLTFGLGALIQRHLWRRWSIFGLAEYTAFKPDLTYTYSNENQIDNTITTQSLTSREIVQMPHLDGGLTFRISRR